jgi:hypothetical protein
MNDPRATDRHAQLTAPSLRNALYHGLMGTALWYLFWFPVANDIPAWAGLLVFPVVSGLSYLLSRMRLRQDADADLLGRGPHGGPRRKS